MNKRLNQLDSIRGIASLIVMLAHISIVTSISMLAFITSKYSPLKILVNGHASVIMFFVLSGFVLSLPYLNNSNYSYGTFITKRIFRIYVPYLIAVSIAILLVEIISPDSIGNLSVWFNRSWTEKVTSTLVFMHYTLIGNFNTDVFNNAIWSLVHEMRISIIFPVLTLLIRKLNWRYVIALCFILSFVSGLNYYIKLEPNYGYHTSLFDTLHYISMFLVGSLLSKHLNELIQFYNKLSHRIKITIFIFALCLYNYSWICNAVFAKIKLVGYSDISGDYVIMMGSIIFIVVSFCSKNIIAILDYKPLRFLGKISFSLYLYHLIILLLLVHLLYSKIPLAIIYLSTVALSILVAKLMYTCVESPSVKLGNNLINLRKHQVEIIKT